MSDKTMLDRALALAAQGFKVFPIFPGKKTPALPNWQNLATTDPDLIKDWFSGQRKVTNKKGKTWIIPSNANIGIHTTKMCVLDLDVKDGTTKGIDSLKTLPPAKTLINKTTTGGLHILFKLPSGVQVGNAANWLPNIDIRGENGYIVAPGSKINGNEYEWINSDVPIAMISPDLLEQVGIKAAAPVENDFGQVGSQYSEMPDTIPSGGRDDAVYKYCCSWRARNISRSNAEILLKELFNRIEQPADDPFTWAEAVAKLDSAWSMPAGTPDEQVTEQVKDDLQAPPDTPPAIADILRRYVFVTTGSQVADLQTKSVVKLPDFKNKMKPIKQRGANDRLIETSSIWMGSSARQEVDGLRYYPDPTTPIINEDGMKYFNTYRPAKLPDVKFDKKMIQPYLGHLQYILPNPDHFKLFLQWMAFTVQYPHERIPWAFLIVTSHKGVGKQIIFDMLAQCVGKHNAIQVTKQALSDTNTFNDFMSDVKLIGFDEVRLQGMDVDKLKFLITANNMEINRKYGTKNKEDVYGNIIIFTNHTDAIQIERGDRRFFISHCRSEAKKDPNYYNNLFKLVHKTSMPAHFLAFLNSIDLTDFHHGQAPPMTAAKQHMYESTVDDVQADVNNMLEDRLGPCAFDIVSSQLVYDYLNVGGDYKNLTKRAVANYLAHALPSNASLPKTQYKVPDVGRDRMISVRCKVIRNADKWAKANPAAVALEYVRAREAVSDVKTRDQIIDDVSRTYKLEVKR